LIQFIGTLSSWWTKIVIGALTLTFIGVQTILANRKSGPKSPPTAAILAARRKQQRLVLGVGAVIVLVVMAIVSVSRYGQAATVDTTEVAQCTVTPFREEEAANLMNDGAVIIYNRIGGPSCINQLIAIYPDGRISGSDGVNKVEDQITAGEVNQLLSTISGEHGWFSGEVFDNFRANLCRQCFGHYVSIAYEEQTKTVKANDGDSHTPPKFLLTISAITPLMPEFNPAP
jgi:hypothetical protein